MSANAEKYPPSSEARHSLGPEESEALLLQQCAGLQSELEVLMAHDKDLTRQFTAARRLLQRITQMPQDDVDRAIQREMNQPKPRKTIAEQWPALIGVLLREWNGRDASSRETTDELAQKLVAVLQNAI